ncbi:hypothetical protein AAKU64_003498 [Undibacterium sp. GrIS 1.8]|uniref:Wzt carbohydrate-binding domain-containing protein n=1 Tax=Undibacterium sp. GrIS 1.8 TaxID=3143934 RepID=UPI0033939A84
MSAFFPIDYLELIWDPIIVRKSKPFSGRVIFDHLGKTGGMAVTSWLKASLGSGTVTDNLMGTHSDLIRRYGGLYPIICAHINFDVELDPRYQYLTLLRDPIDRVSSWLFYADNTVPDTLELAKHKKAAREFLRSDGEVLSKDIVSSISNYYVHHFSQVQKISGISIESEIECAMTVLRDYQIVGLYEQLPQFLSDLATLIGLPAVESIAPVNVTAHRLPVDRLSPVLRQRIIELNQQDLLLYSEVVEWRATVERIENSEPFSLAEQSLVKYELNKNRILTTLDVSIISAVLREGLYVQHGQGLTFDVDFLLTKEVEDLELGMHIYDSDRRWAFGINSTILKQSFKLLSSGLYRATYYLIADLPAGAYTAGFAMNEQVDDGQMQKLAWYDVMCDFQVSHLENMIGIGYSNLPTTIRLKQQQLPESFSFMADDNRLRTQIGSIVDNFICSTNRAGYLIFGPYVAIAAGQYQVNIYGKVGAAGLTGAHMDVAINKGANIIVGAALLGQNEESKLISIVFTLNNFCTDLEIRVWVDSESDLSISSIDIQRQS